jgi:hypothetical protein
MSVPPLAGISQRHSAHLVDIGHLRPSQPRCPASEDDQRRCRCEPSYRTRRRIDGKARWSPVFKDRASAISWDGHEAKAQKAVRAIRRAGTRAS